MERRRSLCFIHSEEEDADHMKRISMCFSIDVSERVKRQNRFHNQVSATERDSRAPGGGLFGNVEDRCPQRSFMSFTVPNKFYADSRDDKYTNTKKNRRKSFVPCEYDESWPREHYGPNRRYQRYDNERYNPRPRRENRVESYDYAMPMKSHRIYNSPRYEEHEERPRRKHYHPRDSYDRKIFREPIPEFVFKKKRERQEKFFEENFELYNCESPTKLTHEFKEPTRNSHRRKSGYSGRDYETSPGISYYHNQPDYYEYKSQPSRRKSVDFFGQDCEIPYNIWKRPKGNRFAESQSCLRFSSVEIPYRRKRRKRSYDLEPETAQRNESGSDFCRPKKRGIDEHIPRGYRRPEKTRGFNPLTRSSQRIWNQGTQVCCQKSRKSLKEKISGFFKRSQSKSRTKCCRHPRGLSLKGRPSRSCLDNFKSVSSISCAVVEKKRPMKPRAKCIAYPTVYREKCPSCCPDPDPDDPEQDEASARAKVNCFQFDCATSKSCCSQSCRQCEASSGSPKAKLTVEAPSCGTEDPLSLMGRNSCGSLARRMPRTVCYGAPKVQCPCCRSSCSTEDLDGSSPVCPGMWPIKCPIGAGSWSSCSAGNISLERNSCPQCASSKKPCCSPSTSQENLSAAPSLPTDIPSAESAACSGSRRTGCSSPPPPPPPPACCCASCVNDLLLHQIKQSTINVCLKICAADGNVLEPAIITARLQPNKPSCSGHNLTATSSKRTRQNNSTCDCNNSIMESPCKCVSSTQSPESTSCFSNTFCSENNYSNVRSVRQLNGRTSSTSCRAQKVLKPILSTSRKKSRETVDCPLQAKVSRSCSEKEKDKEKSCKEKTCYCQVEIEENRSNEKDFGFGENCSDSSKLQLGAASSANPCKKSSAKVEFACCPSPPPPPPPLECPRQCVDRPSFLEELKRELLDRLKSEQQLDCQLPYQKPTPHISIFPCPKQGQSSPHPNLNPNPCDTCWAPL